MVDRSIDRSVGVLFSTLTYEQYTWYFPSSVVCLFLPFTKIESVPILEMVGEGVRKRIKQYVPINIDSGLIHVT